MPGISRRDEWRRAVALFGISIARHETKPHPT